MKFLCTLFLVSSAAIPAHSESHSENLSVSQVTKAGGELLNVGNLEGYPIFTLRTVDGNLLICRVDFGDFSTFVDFRKANSIEIVTTTCSRLD